jgi:FkbM family methyltransferase
VKQFVKALIPPVLWATAKRIQQGLSSRSDVSVEEASEIGRLTEQHVRLNVGLRENQIRIRESLQFNIHPDSRYGFEHFCYLNPEMVDELDSFLQYTKSCSRLLDIGALHGLFSLCFTAQRENAVAYAIDASPIAFCKLLYHVHKNPSSKIIPIEGAVSDRSGELSMHYEWEHAVAGNSNSEGKMLTVPMFTGDEICSANKFEPDCIKIDVEGHEIPVLRGLVRVVSRFRPVIFLEVHPSRIHAAGYRMEEIAQYFMTYGYRPKSIWGSDFAWSQLNEILHDFRIVLHPDPNVAPILKA